MFLIGCDVVEKGWMIWKIMDSSKRIDWHTVYSIYRNISNLLCSQLIATNALLSGNFHNENIKVIKDLNLRWTTLSVFTVNESTIPHNESPLQISKVRFFNWPLFRIERYMTQMLPKRDKQKSPYCKIGKKPRRSIFAALFEISLKLLFKRMYSACWWVFLCTVTQTGTDHDMHEL